MKIFHSHSWNVSLEEAKKIQEGLSKYIRVKDGFQSIKTVGGVEVYFGTTNIAVAVTRFTFPDLGMLDFLSGRFPLQFPYTPNFFVFSCGPGILSILDKMDIPDLLIFPGKGIAHPRKVGLATHLGILLDIPTIACSKRALTHTYSEPGEKKGTFEPILQGKEKVGVVLRSKTLTNPVFISPGHKISLKSSLEITLGCCTKYRLPEPLRQAQILAKKEIS